jgi:hypothetical protein
MFACVKLEIKGDQSMSMSSKAFLWQSQREISDNKRDSKLVSFKQCDQSPKLATKFVQCVMGNFSKTSKLRFKTIRKEAQ